MSWKVNWNELKINSIEYQLKVNWYHLKINENELKINWKQTEINLDPYLDHEQKVIQTRIPQKLLAYRDPFKCWGGGSDTNQDPTVYIYT